MEDLEEFRKQTRDWLEKIVRQWPEEPGTSP